MHRSSHLIALRTPALVAVLLCAIATAGCASSASGPRAHIVTTPPTQAAQIIAIVTDHPRYRSSEAIGVIVRNVTATPFYAIEQYSACTMLQLQFRHGSNWEMTQPCIGGPQPQVRLLAPKVAFPLSFGPGNAPDNPNLWRAGTYRFALLYTARADGSNATTYSYSAGFEVTA
ncbi:MAG TPA: hypothetical protein VGR57_07140 [Ktedonobacterales bacterium]|nr:hypothetical protein [Ktedonobacterales bacterium]